MTGANVSHAAVELQSASQLRKGAEDGKGKRDREKKSEADRYKVLSKWTWGKKEVVLCEGSRRGEIEDFERNKQ